jgi:hypothetical protein
MLSAAGTFENRLTRVETEVVNLKSDADRVEEKIDGLKNWMLGVLTAGYGALALAVVGYLLSRK